MTNALNPHWRDLHQRFTSGDEMTAEELSAYEEECRMSDASEILDGDQDCLRILRQRITQAEVEQQRLRRQKQVLDEQIRRELDFSTLGGAETECKQAVEEALAAMDAGCGLVSFEEACRRWGEQKATRPTQSE